MDSRTNQTLDALADLFLTGVLPPAPPPPAGPAPAPPGAASVQVVRLAPKIVVPACPAPRIPPARLPSAQPELRLQPVAAPATIAPPAPPAASAPATPGGNGAAHASAATPAPGSAPGLTPGSAPKSVAGPAPARLWRHRGPAIAAPPASTAPAAPGNPRTDLRVEAVFLGSLPGFGGPWLTQYAHHLAQDYGSVAVLYVGDGRIDLELVKAGPPAPSDSDTPDALDGTLDLEGQSLPDVLGELAYDTAAPVRCFLVNLDEPTSARDLPRALTLDRWTILCGAYDTAIVGVGRLLQQLAQGSGEGSGLGVQGSGFRAQGSGLRSDDDRPAHGGSSTHLGLDWRHPAQQRGSEPATRNAQPDTGPRLDRQVGLVVMGSEQATARLAALKLNAATSGFLRQPVELLASRKQMVPVNVLLLGSFPDSAAVPAAGNGSNGKSAADRWPELLAFFAELEAQVAAEPADVAPAPEPVRAARPPEPAAPPRPAAPLAAPVVAEPAPPAPQPVHAVAPVEPPAAAPLPDDPAAPFSFETGALFPDQTLAAVEPDLAQFLATSGAVPGGIALQARCPSHPDTLLLLDQHGRLHLLRRHVGTPITSAIPAACAAPDLTAEALPGGALRAALVDLLETRNWVRHHLALLQLTQRQCRFDPGVEPVLHLFTDQAKLAVALTSRFGSLIRLHLLQMIRTPAASGAADAGVWACTDLN